MSKYLRTLFFVSFLCPWSDFLWLLSSSLFSLPASFLDIWSLCFMDGPVRILHPNPVCPCVSTIYPHPSSSPCVLSESIVSFHLVSIPPIPL